MIQIITNNKKKYDNFSNNNFIISEIDDFQSFDNFEITIIDISDSALWYSKRDTKDINVSSDFKSINNAISRSKKTNIIILFPQNIYFHYAQSYSSSARQYKYTESKKIKDIKEDFISIITKYLINMDNIRINYGKTYTKINNVRYEADFSFVNMVDSNVRMRAENNNDVTVIDKNGILITTLKMNSEEEVMNFLQKYFIDCFNKYDKQPEWLSDINFFTDSDCKKEILNIDKKIEELKTNRIQYEEILENNLKYKSILYESGNTLSNQINNMLSEIFEYDNSDFEDTYEEDGRVKLEDITFIIETKGLNNEISGHNVSDACNHLIVYEDMLEQGNIIEDAKCLFIVAYERNKKPHDRVDIKDRIEKIAKANNTLIIDTRVFLDIFEDFLNDKLDKDEIKEIFKNNIGILKYKKKFKIK